MATLNQGHDLRLLLYGQQVTNSWTLPAAAETDTLFTVTGGYVIVTFLAGIVTTVIGSTATTLELGMKPDGTHGTEEKAGICTATAITSVEAGSAVIPLSSSSGPGALKVGTDGGNALYTPVNVGFMAPPGVIEATTSAAAGGGVISWYLMYVPLDTGAYVS